MFNDINSLDVVSRCYRCYTLVNKSITRERWPENSYQNQWLAVLSTRMACASPAPVVARVGRHPRFVGPSRLVPQVVGGLLRMALATQPLEVVPIIRPAIDQRDFVIDLFGCCDAPGALARCA